MGCTVPTRRPERKLSYQILRKIQPKMARSDTLGSVITGNITYSRLNSGLIPICLKLSIYSERHKILKSLISLSGTQLYMASLEYASDFTNIKQMYSQYLAEYTYFCTLVHQVCVNRFELTDGVFIMLISILANKGASLKFLSKPPYIEITGEISQESSAIFNSWVKLSSTINGVLKNSTSKLIRYSKRLEIFKDLMKNNPEYFYRRVKIEKAIHMCDLAISSSKDLLIKCNHHRVLCLEFFESIKNNSKDLVKTSARAQDLNTYSGERIVHTILSN